MLLLIDRQTDIVIRPYIIDNDNDTFRYSNIVKEKVMRPPTKTHLVASVKVTY